MSRICVPVCVRHIDELPRAIDAAAAVADIVELRADCLSTADAHSLLQIVRDPKRQLILTLRRPEEGGHSPIDFETRRSFWLALNDLPADSLIDLELDLVEEFSQPESARGLPIDWANVICSHHDFTHTPANLPQIFARMAATPAGIIKIAVQAEDAIDCLTLFDLINQAELRDRKIIAVAMGQPGAMTRILGPSRGSFLTYGSLDSESGTAPGQITINDLRDLYRIDRIDRDTEIFGIIGQPVAHSFSPHIHNAAFAAAGLNAVYIPFEVHDVLEFIKRMAHPQTREIDWRLKGLSVTAPHKSQVIQSLDWIDPVARAIGAVNTIVVHDDELHGYNVDAAGFISPLLKMLGAVRDARCAVIGAGGAARACVWALKNEGAEVTIFARDESKAESLANAFEVEHHQLNAAGFADFDLVVNTTPLGTQGESANETPVTAEQLHGVRLAYDLVYNPALTQFLREARAAECEVLSGIEMLLAQAVEQFKLWTGRAPDADVMRAAVLRAFEQ